MDSQGTRPRVIDHVVTVAQIQDICTGYRRLTMDAGGLFEVFTPMPGGYLMLSLVDGDAKVQRAYSIHSVTQDSFLLDFVVHDPPGPGCLWASTATVGTQVLVSEPPYHLEIPQTSQALLIADTSALPAAATIADTLTAKVTLIIVDGDPAHGPDFFSRFRDLSHSSKNHDGPIQNQLQVRQLPELSTDSLKNIVASMDPQDCFLWAAGERSLAKQVREFTRQEFQVPRSAQHIQTYWISAW
ncbi:MAG: SIP domain-containing protein [Propionibacteriaceae bacterium]|jgi:ATP-binding cassette subfamily B protein IrtA|nr:SIP domain-containing protein [Propionibacteriaceae bacterium]